MPTRLVIMSDTHLPRRARDLPATLWADVDEADVVLHAGDWTDLATLDRLADRAPALLGVRGNNDGPEFADRLPEVARATIDGIAFAMVHETGPAGTREVRADARWAGSDVLVFGHSHIPWDTVTPGGIRLLNPGSPTDRRRQPHLTWMRAVADDGRLEVELVRVPPVARPRGKVGA